MGDMIRCPKCATHHYRNDPCPDELDMVRRFDGESWCIVYLRPNCNVVRVMSNLTDMDDASRNAAGIENEGGHVFTCLPASVLVGACILAANRLGINA